MDDQLSAAASIGETKEDARETIEVKQVSRIRYVHADAGGLVVACFETVAIFPDGTELQMSSVTTSRPVNDVLQDQFLAIEKAARGWLTEDVASAESRM